MHHLLHPPSEQDISAAKSVVTAGLRSTGQPGHAELADALDAVPAGSGFPWAIILPFIWQWIQPHLPPIPFPPLPVPPKP